MKKIASLMFFLAATQAHAIVFEAYKDQLENDLLCGSFPKTELPMHLQLLKETGAIPGNTPLPKSANKASPIKAATGFSVFGFPLTSVLLVPGNAQLAPTLAVTVAASPAVVAKAIEGAAKKRGAALHNIQGNFSGDNEDKGFTISAMKDKAGTMISCSTFTP